MTKQTALPLMTLIFMLTAPLGAAGNAQASAPGPRTRFNAAIEKLKTTPSDRAAREEAIKLAPALKPPPAIPKEATRHFVMAATFQKEAKKPGDFALAVKEYEDALAIAPWWPDAYFNQSVALESAGRFSEAKGSLELYLLSKPADAETAEQRLYALDAKIALAARNAAADRDSIVGAWFYVMNPLPNEPLFFAERRGDGFDIRDNGKFTSLSDVRASERQVSFTGHIGFHGVTNSYSLTLQREELVGVATNNFNSDADPVRFIRKEWNNPNGGNK